MYKIYINGNALLLTDTQSVLDKTSTRKRLVAPYMGKTKMLLSYIDMLEKTDRFEEVILYHDNPKKLLKDLESLFVVVKAAGGVVKNEEGKLLLIFRRGFWDLPKGKIDKGEKKKQAALREVNEETGVIDLKLKDKLITTRHTYKFKDGRRAMKKTYWYMMEAPQQDLTPQAEEDIELAEWRHYPAEMDPEAPLYGSIRDVLDLSLEA